MRFLSSQQFNLNKSIGDNTSFLSLFLDVPFFFSNKEGSIYRFEASVYNFLKESSRKDYSLEFSMNLKVNFKIMRSIFFGSAEETLNKMTKPAKYYTYLFSNSLRNAGFNSFINTGPLFSASLLNNQGDYFLLDNSSSLLNSLYSSQAILSDNCVDAALPSNKLKYILYTSYFNVDTFVSSYNSLFSYYDFDTSNSFIYNINFPRQNFFILGSCKRTMSFFVRSFDSLYVRSAYSYFLSQ